MNGQPLGAIRAAGRLAPIDRCMLEQLGAALVDEWSELPQALRRTIYQRAFGSVTTREPPGTRRRVARLLRARGAGDPARQA
ncbi:hypothetical protein [Ramlibacter sp. AN1133]|uniref:hypothetical protein n=1 Tax=Ramlibacter sp. AN1133 TaxID=3133429 RepID=UPI0030BD471C